MGSICICNMNNNKACGRVIVVPTISEEEEKEDDTAVFKHAVAEEDILFGTSSDTDEEDSTNDDNVKKDHLQQQQRNDNDYGILKFHAGTEQAMVLFVKEQFAKQQQQQQQMNCNDSDDNHNIDHTTQQPPPLQLLQRQQRILHWIDEFCMTRHWMMHVGPEKGRILQEFLIQRFQYYTTSTNPKWIIDPNSTNSRSCSSSSSSSSTATQPPPPPPPPPFVMVELGTYCAYSTIRMAHAILEYLANISSSSRGRSDFHIYTVDIHSQTVARQLVEMAGLSQHITFIQRPPVAAISELDDLSELLRSCITSSPKSSSAYDNNPKIDFLFIDHAKELYLSDLMQLERSQLLQADSAVVADNVVFFGIDEYRQHMAELQNHNECIVQTRLVSENIYLEYAVVLPNKTEKNPPTNHEPQQQSQAQDLHALGDGLELTVYLKDPWHFYAPKSQQ